MGGVGRPAARNCDGMEVERVWDDVGKKRSCAKESMKHTVGGSTVGSEV